MLRTQTRALERIAQYLGEQEARRIVGSIADAQRLEHWGRKVYSQTDQDGILGEILRRIGAGPNAGILIEFGVEDGLQNNTHWLLRQGYPSCGSKPAIATWRACVGCSGTTSGMAP